MKRGIFLIMGMMASLQMVFGQIEVRKPSVDIIINGKMCQNGDEITVQKGEMLDVKAIQRGGRRDFVSYPDTYLNITSQTQVLKRGNDRLVYAENGKKAEWKLINERAVFLSDEHLLVKSDPASANTVSARVGVDDFNRTYLKVDLTTIWEYTSGDEQKLEKNNSQAFVYLNIKGATDTWYVSQNIHSLGIKNDNIAAKLDAVQDDFDVTQQHFFKMSYAEVQKDIRALQLSMNDLKNTLQQERTANPSCDVEIHIVGLPSDQVIDDMEVLNRLQNYWSQANALISQKAELRNKTTVSNEEAKNAIQAYLDWQYNLPENWNIILSRYMPQLNNGNVAIPTSLQAIAEDNASVSDHTIAQLKAFWGQRVQNVENEKQSIAQVKSRLQAVKLFDGMLRSYFSSTSWIEWENNRNMGFALAK